MNSPLRRLSTIPWLKALAVLAIAAVALAWVSTQYAFVLDFSFDPAPPRKTMTFQLCLMTILAGWFTAIAFIRMPSETRRVLLLLFFMSACLFFIRMQHVKGHYDVLAQVFQGRAKAPNQYRMLVPTLAAGVRWLFPDLNWTDAARVWNLIFCLIWPPIVLKYLRHWFDGRIALLLTMAMLLMMPLTFVYEYPDDMLEIAIFTLGFWFLRDRRFKSLWALIFVATFSRETTAFLVAATFFTLFDFGQLKDRRRLAKTIGLSAMSLLMWLVPFIGLHLAYGFRSYRCQFFMGLINLNYVKKAWILKDSLFFEFLFIIGGMLLATVMLASWKRMDEFLKRNVITLVLMLVVTYCIAMIGEVRVFYPTLPLLIPMAASRLIGPDHSAPQAASA